MKDATIIGVDLAKNVFQVHGATADGSVAFRKKLSRPQFHKFMSALPSCLVVMEACGGAHFWAREMMRLGHEAKLIAPRYVKPFVKRHKNDANDAEAIVEAAQRPTMRFVDVKTEDQQERAIVFRVREQLVNQRTELVNALRSHLYEFGYIAPQGIWHLKRLEEIIADEHTDLPDVVRGICRGLLEQIGQIEARVDDLKKQIDTLSRQAETTRRLRTMPRGGSDPGPRGRNLRAADGELQTRPRFRRMARSRAAAEVERRETAARKDVEDGAARHPAAPHRRRNVRRGWRLAERTARGILAREDDGTKAEDARCRRLGQQDGPRHLGHADEG